MKAMLKDYESKQLSRNTKDISKFNTVDSKEKANKRY